MRKIIVSNMVSVDGFFAGVDGNIDWHNVDDEFNQYAIDLSKDVDTILFGRVTYQLFESYWPGALKDPSTFQDDLKIASWIEECKKIVFSRTLNNVSWNNSQIIKENIKEELEKIKQQDGKDMIIFGSGTITSLLSELGLIDEYRIFVAPVVLGQGKSQFAGLKNQMKFNLLSTRSFKNGNVLLIYGRV